MSDETSRTDAAAYRARLDNRLMEERHDAVLALREAGQEPFANGFAQRHTAAEARALGGEQTSEELEAAKIEVSVAGRIRFFRRMGKAAFVKIQDRSTAPPADDEEEGFLQLFLSVDALGQEAFDASRALMLGDIVGVEGTLMRTRTGELSVLAREIRVLTKSIRPLPEKYKGLSDVEQRFRQRYVDLLVNAESRRIFRTRSLIVQRIREFLMARDFMEVETPMMHVTPGGAVARPFVTHHNALDIDLFLRIAPELYLKRLLVGGFERVFELNRNFRNEGLSRQHNPEFTMLEFYQAYASYEHLMDLTEEMISGIAEELHGRRADGKVIVEAEGHCIDLTPGWRRISVTAAVAEHFGVDEAEAGSREFLLKEARLQHIENPEAMDTGKLLMEAFEHNVEHRLIQPTFVTGFPASVSPLARRSADNPDFVDRFELFICGRELANAFNELNDPEDQYMRFCAQLREREAGDDEAMPMDEDYIRALEYGMPPAAGEGIGIDRLTMLLTGAESIREVILFPHLRPEQSA